jgi:biopolymer transport protein ExbD
MAKRAIPEINAGSMADIAFLLLLFFLVTTTMDRDQAYVRKIPKKIDIPLDQDVEVEKRNILAIKANNQNQLMVRGEVFSDPSKISEFILKFYQTNEKVNDPSNNFPMYSTTTLALCEQQMTELDRQIEEAERVGNSKLAEFFLSSYDEWNKKKQALKLYGKNEMRELAVQAHIRIEVQEQTAYSIFSQIHNEIEEAIFELRDKECMRLFSESYGILKRRHAQDSDPKDKSKLDLLEILYPARIIEVTPKN